jgi:hypothetical protein
MNEELENILINRITINGTIEQIGGEDNPRIIVRDNYGHLITLDVSEDDCKSVKHRLYDEVSIIFDARFSFLTTQTKIK